MKTFNVMALIDQTNQWQFITAYKDAVGSIRPVTIWTPVEFYTIVRAHYNHMLFDSYQAADTQTDAEALATAKAEFSGCFTAFTALNGENFARALVAMESFYNPLENYDRYEEGGEETARHKGSQETRTIDEAGTDTLEKHHGTKTATGEETIVTPRVKTKNTTYKIPYDTSTETETDALVSEPIEGTDKTERDAAKNYTTVSDIDGTMFDKDVRRFDGRKTTETTKNEDIDANTFDRDTMEYKNRRTHGNIGVTTSQQMLEAECSLRVKAFRESLIRQFIGEFCYYVRGVE